MTEFRLRHQVVHGHDVGYRMAGEGPAIVLVHGLAGSSTTWREVMPALAKRHLVIAPDLLGHGESAKPRGDYSLGAHASGIRDLLVALGVERATFVGHSLGGGVAMQLAYQFPKRCERLVGCDGDRIIPVAHAYATHDAIPGSHLAVIPRAGHFLPFEAPGPFLDALNAFLDTTEPAHTNEDDFRSLVIARAEGDSATR